jgi:hypothetical protein
MAVTFPAWWGPEVRSRVQPLKIEDVMIQRFSEDNIGWSGVLPVYWMPTDEQTQQVLFDDSEAFLRIYRLDGVVDMENRRTFHRVQFAAISESRNTSQDILALVQWVLYAYEDTSYVVMPDGAKVAVKFNGERLGPVLDPQLIRDARLVDMTVEVETPWPKGLPDIRQHLTM